MVEVALVKRGRWAELILNRPDRRNAINGPLGLALSDALGKIESDPEIQIVLLRGADGAFCSGLDLKDFNAEPPPEWLGRFGDIWRTMHKALFQLKNRWWSRSKGSPLTVERRLRWLRLRHSAAVAAKLTLTGRRFYGVELARMGIAYAAPKEGSVIAEATALVEELAEYPDHALERIKATVSAYHEESADVWFDRATRATTGVRSPPRAVT